MNQKLYLVQDLLWICKQNSILVPEFGAYNNMTIEDKHNEYQLMLTSPKMRLHLIFPNGRFILCEGCWDVHKDLKSTTFKTINPYIIQVKNPHLKITLMDLSPVSMRKIWQGVALHVAESELLNKPISHGNNINKSRKGRSTHS